MAKRRKKITLDLKKEIEKINFPELVVKEANQRYGSKVVQVLDEGYKYTWAKAKSNYHNRNQQQKKTAVVTDLTFENRSNGMRITMSNINSGGWGGFTFVIKKWEKRKVLANLVCAMQSLALDTSATQEQQSSGWDYRSSQRTTKTIQVLDRTRRNALAKAFMASKEELELPQYLTDLLKHLEIVIEHQAVLGREAVKGRVTDSFKILMEYGYDETDVLCLWREIVAEQIVTS